MNKKTFNLAALLLCTHIIFQSKAADAAAGDSSDDWFVQFMSTLGNGHLAPLPSAQLTPTQLGAQLAQLSDADLASALKAAGARLTIDAPQGNSRTNGFLKGLYSALDGLATLVLQIGQNTDLSKTKTLKQYLRGTLIKIAGSL